MDPDRLTNECWAESFVMHYTRDFPTPSDTNEIAKLCNLRLDAIDVLTPKLNGDPIPRQRREEVAR